MRILRFIGKRLILALPQLAAVTVVTFVLVRLLPGNPAFQLAGPFATENTLSAMEERLGLDRPMIEQYFKYMGDLMRGDWGDSWFTTRPVVEELKNRLPATLELITLAGLLIVGIGVVTGVFVAVRSTGFISRATSFYSLLAGALPDFWLGLILSYVFFFVLGWVPGPIGRLPVAVSPPPQVTGLYTVDALLNGDWQTMRAALVHMALPVLTLVLVYVGAVIKLVRTSVEEVMNGEMIQFARLSGLPGRIVLRYAIKNSLPPIFTLIAMTYGFLLGGAVLVETVFSWGGLGQYVVNSIQRADYFPVQAFVLVAALFNILLYLAVDIAHVLIDPRVDT